MIRIFLFLFIAIGLSTSLPASAQKRTLPQSKPLQPANQPEIFDFTADTNTEGSPYYQDIAAQQEAAAAADQQASEAVLSDEQVAAGTSAPVRVAEVSTSNYWVLLFVGLAGIMVALVWGYLRFVRKSMP